jgi:RHS repeat-associated protein
VVGFRCGEREREKGIRTGHKEVSFVQRATMARPSPKRRLTPAQIRVLQTCADNHVDGDQELAAILNVSPHTIHAHFKTIKATLQVQSRSGAITMAEELGLVTPPGPWTKKIPQLGYGQPEFSLLDLAREAKSRHELERRRQEERMMGTVRYTVVNGRVLGENRDGVKRDFLSDSVGSTLALVDNTQTKTDTFTYWPYGEERTRTGTTPTPFRYGGANGYYRDSASKTYIRARTLDPKTGRWLTKDPLAMFDPRQDSYAYVKNNPVTLFDPSGTQVIPPNHTKYCGWDRRGPGDPVDCIDIACQKHDKCLDKWSDCWKIGLCNGNLCWDAIYCLTIGCGLSLKCRWVALQIKALFCLGIEPVSVSSLSADTVPGPRKDSK